jgi:type IV fimbrial biogenesis protein FimT
MASKGFTLIEMMITLAIAAILITAAVPSFQEFIKNNRLATQSNAFVTALQVARAEAIKRNLAVTVCKSRNGSDCNDDGTDPAGFEQGWIIFPDQQNRGVRDNNETILNINQGMPLGMSFKCINAGTNAVCVNGEKKVTYGADGTSANNMTLRLCQQGNNKGRLIVINTTGRARVDPAEYQNCP